MVPNQVPSLVETCGTLWILSDSCWNVCGLLVESCWILVLSQLQNRLHLRNARFHGRSSFRRITTLEALKARSCGHRIFAEDRYPWSFGPRLCICAFNLQIVYANISEVEFRGRYNFPDRKRSAGNSFQGANGRLGGAGFFGLPRTLNLLFVKNCERIFPVR